MRYVPIYSVLCFCWWSPRPTWRPTAYGSRSRDVCQWNRTPLWKLGDRLISGKLYKYTVIQSKYFCRSSSVTVTSYKDTLISSSASCNWFIAAMTVWPICSVFSLLTCCLTLLLSDWMITVTHHTIPEQVMQPAMEQLGAGRVMDACYPTQTARTRGPGSATAAHLCKLLPRTWPKEAQTQAKTAPQPVSWPIGRLEIPNSWMFRSKVQPVLHCPIVALVLKMQNTPAW